MTFKTTLALGWVLLLGVGATPALAITADSMTRVFDSYALEKAGDYPGAVAKMTSVLAENQGDYYVNLRLGWLFTQVKKPKNAKEHYEKAAAIASGSIEPLLGLGLMYFNSGNYEGTVTVSERLLERDPKNYIGMQRLISAQIKLKNYTAAAAKAEVATKLYPADPVFLEQRAFALMEAGSVADAKRILGHLLVVNPANAYAHAVLGDTLAH